MATKSRKSRLNNWVELRTVQGKLACRYDPERRLIEYVHRGEKTLFDLMEIERKNIAKDSEV